MTLRDCPFCGKAPDLSDPDTLYPSGICWRDEVELGCRVYFGLHDAQPGDGQCATLHCTKQTGGCGAEMHADSRDETIAAWNRRTGPISRFRSIFRGFRHFFAFFGVRARSLPHSDRY